jgi:hypothetical protein
MEKGEEMTGYLIATNSQWFGSRQEKLEALGYRVEFDNERSTNVVYDPQGKELFDYDMEPCIDGAWACLIHELREAGELE